MALLEQILHQAEIKGSSHLPTPLTAIDEAIQRVFSSPLEETKLQKARSIMGPALLDIPDEDLEIYLTEFQYLIDGWFDGFEQNMFNGATLKQVLGQS